jgi:hypothetical protein
MKIVVLDHPTGLFYTVSINKLLTKLIGKTLGWYVKVPFGFVYRRVT